MTVVSGEQWKFTAPINIVSQQDFHLHDEVRNLVKSTQVNTITFYTFGRLIDSMALDQDLIAIANLTGTGIIYYRSAPNTWSPVVMGSGITFIQGTLSASALNIGSIIGVLKSTGDGTVIQATEGTDYYKPGGTNVSVADGGTNADNASGARANLGLVIGTDIQQQNINLQSLSNLNNTNKIVYQLSSGSWSNITVGSGLNFTSGILTASGGGSGTQGPIGPSGATGSTGASGISVVWRGNWSNSINYTTNDLVYYTGSSWISIVTNNSGNIPYNNTGYWNIVSSGAQGISGLQGQQGIQGNTGPTGATGPTGTSGTGFYWRGVWDTGTSYINSEVVYYNGSSWISITGSNLNRTPDVSSLYWSLLALSGTQGTQGIQGPSGSQGPSGAQGPAGSGSGVGPDLTAIEALTGSGVIYYRSGDGVWNPITISTGLSFSNGVLMATGTGGALDADLNSLAAATGLQTIYYRSAASTWSPVALASGIFFTGGTLYISNDSYDLEQDIGVIPWDKTDAVMTYNTNRLNGAMAAMCPTGLFTFMNGLTGPIMKPISCAGKSFYFNGNLRTSYKWGGEIRGVGTSYPEGDWSHGAGGPIGAQTRFVRIGATGAEGEFVFLLRNNGFKLSNIHFFGGYASGNINYYSGASVHTILGVEGHVDPPCGQHTITNCAFFFGGTGIRFMSGYYNTSNVFVGDENHADNSIWTKCMSNLVKTCVKSESQQAVNHHFYSCYFLPNRSGAVFDYLRGGHMEAHGLYLGGSPDTTVLRISQWSPNNARFTIDVEKDGWFPYASGFRLLEHYGVGLSWYKWSIRFLGSVNNANECSSMTGIAFYNGITGNDVWYDMSNLDYIPAPTGYQWEQVGPWRRLNPSGWS